MNERRIARLTRYASVIIKANKISQYTVSENFKKAFLKIITEGTTISYRFTRNQF